MNTNTPTLVLLATLLVPMSSEGADIVLRDRATQLGTIVRLGDVADISAASSTELTELSSTPLMPAPAEGTRQFLNAAQVRDLIAARGIRVGALRFRGASIVEIGTAPSPSANESQASTSQIPPEKTEASVQRAIEQWLQDQKVEGRWRVELVLSDRAIRQVTELDTIAAVSGPQQLRSGRQRFFLRDSTGKQEAIVPAEITHIRSVVITRQSIERGGMVRAADVELQEREGNLPSGALTSLSQVVGKVAERGIRADDIVQENQLRAPWQVRRGETVSVFVRTGGVVVRTRAIAKADGALGDLIPVETIEGKNRLDASVSGPGEVAVHATGGRATDYASLNRNDRQLK